MGIGDELMAAGAARRERARLQYGPVGVVDRWGRRRWHPIWDYCPDVARPEVRAPVITNAGKARPYIDWPGSDATRWKFIPYRPEPARVELPADVRAWAEQYRGRVVIESRIKAGAPVNKQWGKWSELQARRPDIPWLPMPELPSFIHALAVLSVARAAVLPEGGLHHGAAAMGLRAVVIFGGYVSPANTGYDMHRNLFTGGEPCGNRQPCAHCREAMSQITPAMVLRELEQIL